MTPEERARKIWGAAGFSLIGRERGQMEAAIAAAIRAAVEEEQMGCIFDISDLRAKLLSGGGSDADRIKFEAFTEAMCAISSRSSVDTAPPHD